MRALAICGVFFLLLGCAHEYARIPRLTEPWEIKGRVQGEDGETIPKDLKIDLVRLEARPLWCLMCLGGYKPFASTYAAADGPFYLSSTVSGDYSLRAYCPAGMSGVPLFEPLGTLSSGARAVVANYRSRNCVAAH
jgi:hypothetical protein